MPADFANTVADAAIMPGHIQGTNVLNINHIGENLPNFRANPTKILSPVTSV